MLRTSLLTTMTGTNAKRILLFHKCEYTVLFSNIVIAIMDIGQYSFCSPNFAIAIGVSFNLLTLFLHCFIASFLYRTLIFIAYLSIVTIKVYLQLPAVIELLYF